MPDGTAAGTSATGSPADPPNVVIFICDDLEYGSLGCHGNTIVDTPNVDAFYEESVRLDRYYAGPMCSPARASLQTGRWHYRTGVLHPSIGQSLMHPDEVTIAELVDAAGYRTFHGGKWHLGDNYPLRPHDQGYEEALYMRGYGTGGWGDKPNSYVDPSLHRNGVRESFEGLVDEIVTDAAISFIQDHADEPFLMNVAPDGPVAPEITVSEEYVQPYRDRGLPEEVARYYGFVTLLDEQFGRLCETLDEAGLAANTLVIFTSDHGSNFSYPVFDAGLRGGVGDVYEGGIRVPCFMRWPAQIGAGRDVEQITHAVDILPTIAGLTGQPLPDRPIDGRDLQPLLRGLTESDWPDRRLFVQQTQSDRPALYDNAAVITQQYKLVDGRELYDLAADPGEQQNIAASHPQIVADLRTAYEAWFDDVRAERDFATPRIVVGSSNENPSRLTRNDWLGPRRNGKSDEDIGYWDVIVDRAGEYDITCGFPDVRGASGEQYGTIHCRVGDVHRSHRVPRGESQHTFTDVELAEGPARVEGWLEVQAAVPYGQAPTECGLRFAELEYTEVA